MFILMSFLVMGVKFEPTSLVDLHGKWTVGLSMKSLLVFSEYSILWRPWKTVTVGIGGSSPSAERERRRRRDSGSDYDYERWGGSVGIGVHKYFRAHSSFSPYVALSPRFSVDYQYYDEAEWLEYSSQTYRASFDSGVEYFFTLYGKQLSLRLETSLLKVSRTYERKEGYSEEESSIRDYIYFHLPGNGSLSTWLCFHF